MPRHCHDTPRHILITAWNGNTRIMVLSTGDGFDAIGNDFSSLQGESHACEVSHRLIARTNGNLTFSSHGNGIRNTDGIVLPSEHSLLLNRILDDFAQLKHCRPSDFVLELGGKDSFGGRLTVHTGQRFSHACTMVTDGIIVTYLHGLPSHQTEATPT